MAKLSPEKIGKVLLEVNSVPEAVGVSELFWLDVEVTNATSEILHSRPPVLPVHLSYHWIDKVARRTVQEEICWFDQVRPDILQEIDVLVTAGTHHNMVSSSRKASDEQNT